MQMYRLNDENGFRFKNFGRWYPQLASFYVQKDVSSIDSIKGSGCSLERRERQREIGVRILF